MCNKSVSYVIGAEQHDQDPSYQSRLEEIDELVKVTLRLVQADKRLQTPPPSVEPPKIYMAKTNHRGGTLDYLQLLSMNNQVETANLG
jgi:hypothetical protein